MLVALRKQSHWLFSKAKKYMYMLRCTPETHSGRKEIAPKPMGIKNRKDLCSSVHQAWHPTGVNQKVIRLSLLFLYSIQLKSDMGRNMELHHSRARHIWEAYGSFVGTELWKRLHDVFFLPSYNSKRYRQYVIDVTRVNKCNLKQRTTEIVEK